MKCRAPSRHLVQQPKQRQHVFASSNHSSYVCLYKGPLPLRVVSVLRPLGTSWFIVAGHKYICNSKYCPNETHAHCFQRFARPAPPTFSSYKTSKVVFPAGAVVASLSVYQSYSGTDGLAFDMQPWLAQRRTLASSTLVLLGQTPSSHCVGAR